MEKIVKRIRHNKKFNGYSGAAKVVRAVVVVIFTIYAVLLMFPYFYALDISFMENGGLS